jgi:hypothetical protein
MPNVNLCPYSAELISCLRIQLDKVHAAANKLTNVMGAETHDTFSATCVQAMAEVSITRKFLENFSGDQVNTGIDYLF